MDPSVDVVIATYNRASTLARALDSVLAQDYPRVEVIVVDDGSTDETPDVLDPYRDRVRILTQPNRERGAARNTGLRAGAGDYVLFLDSDDELLPGAVMCLVETLRSHPDAGLVYGEAEFFDDETGEVFDVFPREPAEGDVFLASARRNLMVIDSVLVRRTLLAEVGGFSERRDLSGMEDWELWTRCLARSPVVFTARRVVRVHFHELNTVGNPLQMEKAILTANEEMLSHPLTASRLSPHRSRLRAGVWALIAHHHMLSGDTSAARRTVVRGLRENPRLVLHPVFGSMAIKVAVGSRVVAVLRAARRSRYLSGRAA